MKKLIILILITVIFSCQNEQVNETSDDITTGLQTKTFFHDNLEREYLIHIPNNLDLNLKYPIIFNFHGYGGTSDQFMINADMRNLAENENFIVIYPQGSSLFGSKDSHWNSSKPSADNKSNTDDIGFIENLIDYLIETYSFMDSSRIYAAGYSNGGFFSYFLACNSQKFAAIGSVAGTMIDDSYTDCNAQFPTAMINIHGTSDSVVLYNGDNLGSTSIQDVINWWKNFNVSTNEVKTTSSDNSIERFTYSNSSNEVYVEHYKIINGEHYWDDKIDYNGKNTSELIWDFVSNYDINGIIN